MRIIGDTNIPFLSYRKIALSISMAIIVAGLAYQFLGPGLNLGIDFVGGTQVTIKFRSAPDLGQLRATMADLDTGTPSLQRFDEAEKHEILIRVENPEGEDGDFTGPIIELLDRDLNAGIGDAFDLNTQGAENVFRAALGIREVYQPVVLEVRVEDHVEQAALPREIDRRHAGQGLANHAFR